MQHSSAVHAATRRAHGLSGWEAAALKAIAEELDAEESITLKQFDDYTSTGHSDQASLRVYVNVTPEGHSVALSWRFFTHVTPDVRHRIAQSGVEPDAIDDAIDDYYFNALEVQQWSLLSETLRAVEDLSLPPGTYLVEWTFGMRRSLVSWYAEQMVFRGQPRWQEVGAVLQSPKWSKP